VTGVVLASTSAMRASLLAAAGVDFAVEDSGVDEALLKQALLDGGAGPREVAEVLAEAKAVAVSARRPGWVIGADQTLDLKGALLDKAGTIDDARERLRGLRGASHQLHAAVVVAADGAAVWRDTVTCRLTMRVFTDAFLDAYLARNADAALSAVGCYHLEGEGVQLFDRIEGDYFAILGLPLLGLLGHLRQNGELPE
jgi:septum formation protein